jgi:hypothetical protein
MLRFEIQDSSGAPGEKSKRKDDELVKKAVGPPRSSMLECWLQFFLPLVAFVAGAVAAITTLYLMHVDSIHW